MLLLACLMLLHTRRAVGAVHMLLQPCEGVCRALPAQPANTVAELATVWSAGPAKACHTAADLSHYSKRFASTCAHADYILKMIRIALSWPHILHVHVAEICPSRHCACAFMAVKHVVSAMMISMVGDFNLAGVRSAQTQTEHKPCVQPWSQAKCQEVRSAQTQIEHKPYMAQPWSQANAAASCEGDCHL